MGTWIVVYKRTNGTEGRRQVQASSSAIAEAKVKKSVGKNWLHVIYVRMVK